MCSLYFVLLCVSCDPRNAADRVVQGQGKYEELVVCSQEIAASTTQLVVASKVKASRGSENLQNLSDASKGVTSATGQVVASAKSAAQRIEEMGMCSNMQGILMFVRYLLKLLFEKVTICVV